MSALPEGCSHLPGFFGEPDRQLWGCYHPPRGGARAAERVVLLASALGHEHMRCHRTFWRLADQLARSGVGVLRFDFLGLGDSALESDEVVLEDWLGSIERAAVWARELSGARTVDFVGLRLGATLGALAAASGRVRLGRLLLWQPVVRGSEWIEELVAEHARFAASLRSQPVASDGGIDDGPGSVSGDTPGGAPLSIGSGSGDDPVELLGYRFARTLLRELEPIDLERGTAPVADELILLETLETRSYDGLASALADSGASVRHEHRPDDAVWSAEPYKQVMPHATIRSIVELLSGVPA